MKFTIVLVITVIATVTIGIAAKKIKFQEKSELISPTVKETYDSYTNSTTDTSDWKAFVNNYYGYEIKHPGELEIINKKNGDVRLQKDSSIIISITQNVLTEDGTINTLIESEIGAKQSKLGNQFKLSRNIEPIALGNVTAQTYSSKESSKNVTYYFVPQNDKKYLYITNETPESVNGDYFLSEKIIYSLDLYP